MKIEGQKPNEVRRCAHAGKLYPADPIVLGAEIDSIIAATNRPMAAKGEIGGVIAPFDPRLLFGESRLGALRALNRQSFTTVFLIATAQENFFSYASLYSGGAYDTPLGRVFVDLATALRMANAHPQVILSSNGHTGGQQAEYAIECLLPILQRLIGGFKIVPIVMGTDDRELAIAVGEVISAEVALRPLVVTCSQIEFNEDAARQESAAQKLVASMSDLSFTVVADRLAGHPIPGSGPLLALLYASRRMGIKRVVPFEDSIAREDAAATVWSAALMR